MKNKIKMTALVTFCIVCLIISTIGVVAEAFDNTVLETNLAYQSPDPVEPGELVELKLNIKNVGGNTAKSVEFQLVPEFPLTIYEEDTATKAVGDIKVYDSGETETNEISVKYRLGVDINALEGTYDLQLKYKAIGGSSVGVWQDLDPIQVKVQTSKTQLHVVEAKTTPERPGPGETFKFSLTVKNMGASTLEDIKVIPDVTNTTYFSPYQSSNEKIVKSLKTNEETTIVYDIISAADTPLKPHRIPLKLTFKDPSGKSYEKSIVISVIIDKTPEYVLNLEDTDIYQKGERGKAVLSISNVGSSDINFVTIDLQESENYEIISSSTMYVGNLESDDYETAQFDIYVSKYEKELPLNVILYYKDNFNKQYVDEVTLPLKLFTAREAAVYGVSKKKGNTAIFIVIVLLLLGGGAYYFKYYKKGKKLTF